VSIHKALQIHGVDPIIIGNEGGVRVRKSRDDETYVMPTLGALIRVRILIVRPVVSIFLVEVEPDGAQHSSRRVNAVGQHIDLPWNSDPVGDANHLEVSTLVLLFLINKTPDVEDEKRGPHHSVGLEDIAFDVAMHTPAISIFARTIAIIQERFHGDRAVVLDHQLSKGAAGVTQVLVVGIDNRMLLVHTSRLHTVLIGDVNRLHSVLEETRAIALHGFANEGAQSSDGLLARPKLLLEVLVFDESVEAGLKSSSLIPSISVVEV
jgi:hypothetical protein